MPVECVIGLQWGDEGKGKIVDALAKDVDYVVRFQGGGNAGHTVVVNNKKFVLHLVPSGIFHRNTKCVLGNGTVIEPVLLVKEIRSLKKSVADLDRRLFISERAHIVLNLHKDIDRAENSSRLGTTVQGIGPCYSDKFARIGVRMVDVMNEKWIDKLQEIYSVRKSLLKKESDLDEEIKRIRTSMKYLKRYICDTSKLIREALKNGARILLEGAQGTLLDIDFGTYPYVTSSSSSVFGASSGSGIPPREIKKVIGVFKAYTTRVGSGPFPTECEREIEESIRMKGQEFGATTGRPRRCGWLDLVALKYAVEINDVDYLCITKLDVLTGFDNIKVAAAYRFNDKIITEFPASADVLYKCKPIYESLPGWRSSIQGCTSYRELPKNARNYIDYIAKALQRKIKIISVSPERKDVIYLN